MGKRMVSAQSRIKIVIILTGRSGQHLAEQGTFLQSGGAGEPEVGPQCRLEGRDGRGQVFGGIEPVGRSFRIDPVGSIRLQSQRYFIHRPVQDAG